MKRKNKLEPKICPACNKSFTKKANWNRSYWAKRIYCSAPCRIKPVEPAEKRCPTCGKIFTKRANYSQAYWAKQIYCSLNCSGTVIRNGQPPSNSFKFDALIELKSWQKKYKLYADLIKLVDEKRLEEMLQIYELKRAIANTTFF